MRYRYRFSSLHQKYRFSPPPRRGKLEEYIALGGGGRRVGATIGNSTVGIYGVFGVHWFSLLHTGFVQPLQYSVQPGRGGGQQDVLDQLLGWD